MNRALEPVMERQYDDRAELRPEGLTTLSHTESYLSGDFILMCFGKTVNKRKPIFVIFQENQTLFEKFLNN